MGVYKILTVLILAVFLFQACGIEDDVDQRKPEIDLDITDAFPLNCDTIYFGESFTFTALFIDNVELGNTNAYSISIHNNFDHHSHSTEVTECTPGPEMDPVNPFSFIGSYSVPGGLKEYKASFSISLPEGDNNGAFDEGEYHFFISLTDKAGWSAQKGLSIKILHR